MTLNSFRPIYAKLLMAAGVIPFAGLAVALHVWPLPMLHFALLSYASIIISFIAGTHWAFVFSDTSIKRSNLMIAQSNLLALLAWAGFCLHFTDLSEPLFIGCLLGQLAIDVKWLGRIHAPWYRRWRTNITIIVCASLALAFFAPT